MKILVEMSEEEFDMFRAYRVSGNNKTVNDLRSIADRVFNDLKSGDIILDFCDNPEDIKFFLISFINDYKDTYVTSNLKN